MEHLEKKYIELQEEEWDLYMKFNYDKSYSAEKHNQMISRQQTIKQEIMDIKVLLLRYEKIKKIVNG